MKQLKYIIFVILAALSASCAKEEEFSMGTYKYQVRTNNITPEGVVVELDTPADGLDYGVIYLYKDIGNGKAIPAYDEYGSHIYSYDYNSNHFEFDGLEPNTSYSFILMREVSWGNTIYVSDPSFSFTTNVEKGWWNNVELSDVKYNGTKFSGIILKYNEIPEALKNYHLYLTMKVCSDPDGINTVCIMDSSGPNDEFHLYNGCQLEPNTTYYLFVEVDFSYEREHFNLKITPNSFTTPDFSTLTQ